MPASSPGCWSVTSVLKPRAPHQRRYMRSSISAQSWLSVPPAPALIVRMALARSFSPPSIFWNSAPSTMPCRSSREAPRSFCTSSPASSHSSSTRVSSSRPRRRFSRSRSASTRLRRWSTFWAAPWSDQKSPAVIFSSSRVSSERRLPSSKVAANVRGPPLEVLKALLVLVGGHHPSPNDHLTTAGDQGRGRQGHRHGHARPGEDVAVPCVERGVLHQRHVADEHRLVEQLRARDDAASRVDDRRDAGVGVPDQVLAVLHRA